MAPLLQRLKQASWRSVEWRVERLVMPAARVRRHFLRNTVFIGVTGSAGKTTAKQLIVGLLSAQWHGRGNYGTENRPMNIARLVWHTSSSEQFCVSELSADQGMDRMLQILQPKIGVVTALGDDHLSLYGSREAIAQEKGKLIAALPSDGIAVLNADQPLIAAMRTRCKGRVVTFGLSPGADVQADDVRSMWPDRLACTVRAGGERVLLQTQLCGDHFVHSVLAAVAVGWSLGFSLENCARAFATIPPFEGRMQPAATPEGITFIRDDWKAPLWTIAPAFKFIEDARAARKVIVVGTLSDYGGDASAQYARVAERALQIADHVVFVGAWASRALRAARGKREGTLRAFSTVSQAAQHLDSMLQPGDLVLLKGTNRKDHLIRTILARKGSVQCWQDDCGREIFCDLCPKLSVRSGAGDALAPISEPRPAGLGLEPGGAKSAVQVIIGLGNPGERYAGAPHNVGHDVLDRLCNTLQASWSEHERALVATHHWKGRDVRLIKLQVPVNASGAAIKALAERLGFDASNCILVHDDLDLQLGTVRARMRGSAGGHRGMASVLDAFQTDAIRRVKLGIGRPDQAKKVVDYVVRPFAEEDRRAVDELCAVAEKRVLELIVQRQSRTAA